MADVNLIAVFLLLACLLLTIVSGRNDGAPIVALAVQSRGLGGWLAMAYFGLLLPGVPLLGFWGVADSLDQLLGPETGQATIASALIVSVLITIGVSNVANIPTSITLAIVGAIIGSTIAQSRLFPGNLLSRVLGLGIAAPFIAAVVAFILSRVLVSDGQVSRRLLLVIKRVTLPLLVLAYAANDGQKVIFVAALALGMPIGDVAGNIVVLGIATAVFLLGIWIGMGHSGRFIRHGVASIRPLDLLWAETATSAAVLAGAGLGVPLSMTQALTGAVVGTGMSHSARSVYWRNVGRIGIAWLWTLPAAGILAYVLVKILA